MGINRQIINPLMFVAFLVTITGSVAGVAADPEVNMKLVGHFWRDDRCC
jgi:hypothetical protein